MYIYIICKCVHILYRSWPEPDSDTIGGDYAQLQRIRDFGHRELDYAFATDDEIKMLGLRKLEVYMYVYVYIYVCVCVCVCVCVYAACRYAAWLVSGA